MKENQIAHSEMTTYTEVLAPPMIRLGPLRWLRENLFSSWYNTLLTIGALFCLGWLFSGLYQWVLASAIWSGGAEACQQARAAALKHDLTGGACWTVVPENLRTLLVGTYPGPELWRVWTCVYFAATLLGLSGGLWGRLVREAAIALGSAGILLFLLPFSWDERLWIGGIALGTFVGLGLGWWRRAQRLWRWNVLILWFFSPVIVTLLLGGFIFHQPSLTQSFSVWSLFLLFGLFVAILLYRRSNLPIPKTFVAFVGFAACAIVGWLVLPEAPIAGLPESVLLGLLPVTTTQWGGLLLTFMLAIVGIVTSFPFGVMLALGRQSSLPIVRWVSVLYIEVIRGVPFISVIFMVSLMLPLALPSHIRVDQAVRVMVAFMLFSAAYIAENVRGGLQAIPRGQYEAARALGLSGLLTTFFIVLPQALRMVIPANVGTFIGLFKDTSLVFMASLLDFFNVGRGVLANPIWIGKDTEVLLFIAFVYWVFTYFMSHMSRRLEKVLGVGER